MNQRIDFIDRFRGWALIFMVETHVFNESLSLPFRTQEWFTVLSFINGLIAPSFLFLSGFVFAFPRFSRPDKIHSFKWKKILMLLMIAYGLHLPFNTLNQTISLTSQDAWLRFFQSDILQCMAAGWTILSLFFALIKKTTAQRKGLWILLFLFVLPAPFFHGKDFTSVLHPAFAAYLNHTHYSMFPLFPWMGFLAAGALTAYFYAQQQQDEHVLRKFVKKIILSSAVLIIPGLFSLFFFTSWFRVNPLAFNLRLGIVLLLSGGFLFLQIRKPGKKPALAELVGSHSLFVYVFHLILLYHPFFNGQSFSALYKRAKDPVFGLIATLTALSLVFTATWMVKRIKNFSPLFYQKIARLILGASLLNFLVKPY